MDFLYSLVIWYTLQNFSLVFIAVASWSVHDLDLTEPKPPFSMYEQLIVGYFSVCNIL